MENSNTTYTLITGASGGIGYEFARIFAKEHHNLILVARNMEKLKRIKSKLESRYKVIVKVYEADLSKRDAC